MSNPHPFYRFSPAWNTGFYPQNQVASNQLNDIYVELLSWLPSNVAGKTISQFYSDVRALIKPYNEFPVFGNFTTTIFKIPDTPNWEYNINIQDVDLSVIDSTQVVTINGTFDPTTQIVNTGTANVFNVGTYSGTFGKSNIPVDQEAVNTLSTSCHCCLLCLLYVPCSQVAERPTLQIAIGSGANPRLRWLDLHLSWKSNTTRAYANEPKQLMVCHSGAGYKPAPVQFVRGLA